MSFVQAYSASSDETRKESIVLSYEEFNALKTQVLSSLHQTNTEKGTERIEKIARFLNERLGARTTVLEKSRAHKTLGAAPHQNLAETCSLILNHFNIYPQNLASQKPAHASYDIRKELRDAGIPEDEIDANFQVPSPHQGSVAHGSHAGAMQRSSMEHDLAQTLRMLEAAGISQDNIAFSQRFGQTSSAQQQQAVEVVSPHLAHTSSAVATPSIEWGVEFEESSEHNPLPKVSSPKFLTLQGKPNKDSIKLLHRNISTERALGFLSNVSKMSRNLKYVFDDAGFYEPSQIHLSLLSGIGSTRASTLFALDNMKTLLTEIQPLCLTKNPFKITGLDFYVHDEKKDSWRTFNLDTQDAASITKDLKTCPDINYGYVVLRAQGIEENPTSCSLKRKWTNPSFLEGSEEFLFDRKMPYNPHITIAQVGVEDTSSFQQLNKKTWVKWQPADVESIVTAVSKIRVSTDKLSNLALGKIAVSTKVRGQILCLGYNDLDSHTVRVNQGLWESTFRGDY